MIGIHTIYKAAVRPSKLLGKPDPSILFVEIMDRKEFPYRDADLGFWVYDKLPKYMVTAKPDDLWVGRYVMYQAQLPPLAGLWIAEKLTSVSIKVARKLAEEGKIFCKS